MLWVDVVNRSLEWETQPGIEELQRVWAPAGLVAAAVRAAAAIVRAAAARRILDPEAEPPWPASQWLAAVTLRTARAERRGGLDLPALRAARPRSDLPPALEELLATALVQLAASPAGGVARCAGVTRAAVPGADPALESAFARLAGLDALLENGCRQCARLVAGPRAGHYCSKACSNAAFALRKAAREPAYFARKQARYRDSKRRAAARVESAFAFVD
jgi:hypothetical protein